MSRLGTSRNVQWSAEGATDSLCSRAHNRMNLSMLRGGYFDERCKNKKDEGNFFLRKMKKCIFGRNPKATYFMTETLIVQKVAYILASFCEGEWFSYLFSVLRKISYKLEKMEKNSEKFFITLFHYPISVMRYTSSSKREPRNFFQKNELFLAKKRRRHT